MATPRYAGSLRRTAQGNGADTLEVLSTKVAGGTTLAHIIRLVGEAQQNRAPSEQWVDRFARFYTPTVMAAAVAVLAIPVLLLAKPFEPCSARRWSCW